MHSLSISAGFNGVLDPELPVLQYSIPLSIYKMLLGRPGASKIIPFAIRSVVGFGATKMVPQGTISLFRGLCEPFLYAKFRNFDAFKWFSGFPTLILKHFGTQNTSSDDFFSGFVWKNRVVHIPSFFWQFFRAKHSKFVGAIKSITIEIHRFTKEKRWFTRFAACSKKIA